RAGRINPLAAVDRSRSPLRPQAHVLLQLAWPTLAAVDVAGRVDSRELRAGAARVARIAPRVQDELGHPARGRVADPNAHFPTGVLDVVGFGVRDDDAAVVVERDAARPAELRPAREPFAVLVEQLDAVVRAIRDE